MTTRSKGFGCRVTAAGARAFVLNYYRRKRRPRAPVHHRLASRNGAWPQRARKPNGSSARSTAVPILSASSEENRAAPTMADLCARFEHDYVPRKRPSTQRVYRQQIATDILPALGRMKVAAVAHADVDAFHHTLSARAPTHANRTLAVLSKMFTLAIRWGWRTDNPCRASSATRRTSGTRYLTGAELTRLSAALAKLPDAAPPMPCGCCC